MSRNTTAPGLGGPLSSTEPTVDESKVSRRADTDVDIEPMPVARYTTDPRAPVTTEDEMLRALRQKKPQIAGLSDAVAVARQLHENKQRRDAALRELAEERAAEAPTVPRAIPAPGPQAGDAAPSEEQAPPVRRVAETAPAVRVRRATWKLVLLGAIAVALGVVFLLLVRAALHGTEPGPTPSASVTPATPSTSAPLTSATPAVTSVASEPSPPVSASAASASPPAVPNSATTKPSAAPSHVVGAPSSRPSATATPVQTAPVLPPTAPNVPPSAAPQPRPTTDPNPLHLQGM
jgi:hypothetical protein